MERSDYTIDLYQPDQISRVVEFLGQNVWGRTTEENVAYFKWKYHDNPYASQPLGIVAAHGENIVGFRGYFATNWYLGSIDNRITILIPGDTVVRSDHRRQGLSVSMGRLAMERFASSCSVLLNTTASKSAMPGYLRMGFVPLRSKEYFRKSTLTRDVEVMVKAALRKGKNVTDLPADMDKIAFGDFGDIEVSKDPRPKEMAAVVSGDQQATKSITLLQDETFFCWRFANPRGGYVFYFSKSGGQILGYIVIRVSDDIEQGFIVDYGQRDGGHIGRILNYIDSTGVFAELNILDASIDKSILDTFKARRFKDSGLHHLVKKWIYGDRPLMVRPVKQRCSEADWFLGGLDIRDMANWRYRQICQDNV